MRRYVAFERPSTTAEEYLIRKELDDAVTRQQEAMTRQVQPVGFWQNIANQAANFMGWR